MGIYGDIAIILIWAIAFDKCAGESGNYFCEHKRLPTKLSHVKFKGN